MKRRNFIKAMSLAMASVGSAREIFSVAASEYPLSRIQYIGPEDMAAVNMTTAGELTFVPQPATVIDIVEGGYDGQIVEISKMDWGGGIFL